VAALPGPEQAALSRRSWWMGELRDGEAPEWMAQAARWMGAVLVFAIILAALRARFSGKPWMYFFEDDFYYYLKVAQNLANGSGSTFNGVVQTNGYHPLWMLVMTGFSIFSTDSWAIFWFVVTMAFLSTMATFFLARIVLRQANTSKILQTAFAAYLGIYTLHLCYTGMEVILAIPLMFLLIVVVARRDYWQRGWLQSCSLGLIISAMVLSRLDLIMLAGLFAFWIAVNAKVRKSFTVQQAAGLALGLVPLVLYFLSNHQFFGTWLPVSGMAKQLKFNHFPSLKPWASLYGHNRNNWTNLLPIHLALLSLPLVWGRLSSMQRVIFPSILMFPFVYVFLLSCMSDWQLWLWYLYPMRAALCVSFIVFTLWLPTGRIMRTRLVTAAVMLIVLVETGMSKWWTDVQPAIYEAAHDIQQFAKTHPGTYAMGDRSGMVAYLLAYPVIQTEGLVMDRSFLEHIRHQDPLLPTLADYHVRYYVGTAWKPYTGCFHAVEPLQAGKTSAHMLGDLCGTPVASSQHETYQTVIYDLDKEPPH